MDPDALNHFEERIIEQFGDPLADDAYIPFVCRKCGAYIFID